MSSEKLWFGYYSHKAAIMYMEQGEKPGSIYVNTAGEEILITAAYENKETAENHYAWDDRVLHENLVRHVRSATIDDVPLSDEEKKKYVIIPKASRMITNEMEPFDELDGFNKKIYKDRGKMVSLHDQDQLFHPTIPALGGSENLPLKNPKKISDFKLDLTPQGANYIEELTKKLKRGDESEETPTNG